MLTSFPYWCALVLYFSTKQLWFICLYVTTWKFMSKVKQVKTFLYCFRGTYFLARISCLFFITLFYIIVTVMWCCRTYMYTLYKWLNFESIPPGLCLHLSPSVQTVIFCEHWAIVVQCTVYRKDDRVTECARQIRNYMWWNWRLKVGLVGSFINTQEICICANGDLPLLKTSLIKWNMHNMWLDWKYWRQKMKYS